MQLLRRLAARLPQPWQTELKRIRFKRQIQRGSFVANEPEYDMLHDLIQPGDWVVDVGANVGHYSKRFSELVGAQGRVIAFEPVPTTFFLLSANALLFPHPNVTLLNAAVSDQLDVVGVSMPKWSWGLPNYYRAHLSSSSDSALSVLTVSLDSLRIDRPVTLVKIDAEGHEAFVLAGMRKLIEASHPVLIVETECEEVVAGLKELGYLTEQLPGSRNVLFRPDV
jgi:FkbM family methyltransferase